MLEYLARLLHVRGVWIVNKVIGVSWCDAPECKMLQQRVLGGTCRSMFTEVLCLTS